jgi:tetratricopeptide (TPR) repeat protein
MTFRSRTVIGFALLAALSLCAAKTPQNQSTSRADSTTTAQQPELPTPVAASSAPQEPTLSEMRAMTDTQLDKEGDRLRQAKDYLSALDCYREAVRKRATAGYYNKIAITELMLRHPTEAASAAKKALRMDKQMAEAWNNLGVTYYMRNKFKGAIHNYQKAISLQPSFASFHNNLAAAYMDSKKFGLGVAEYRKAFELDPLFFESASLNGISARMGSPQDRAQFSFIMARFFAGSGDLDHALHFLRGAIEDGYPNIDDVYHDKAFAHAMTDARFIALMKDRPVSLR